MRRTLLLPLLLALAAAPAARAATAPAHAPAAVPAPAAPPAGWLGVTLGTTDLLQPDPPRPAAGEPATEADRAAALPATEAPQGAVITGVVKDGPADRAGLRAGDLVVRLGATAVTGPSDVQRAVAAAPPGEWSELEVLRGAQRRTLSVRIGRRDDTQNFELRRAYIGVTPVDVPLQLKEAWGGDEDRGVLVGEVVPSGPAARGGLRPGDLVLGVNGHAVGDPGALLQRIQLGGVGNTAELAVSRQGTLLTLSVDLEDAPPPAAPAPGGRGGDRRRNEDGVPGRPRTGGPRPDQSNR